MLPYPHDPEKHFLGKICPHGHEYYGTGQSLRYLTQRKCVQCMRDHDHRRRGHKPAPFAFASCPWPQIALNPDLHRLGGLCKRQHDYGDGHSILYKNGHSCVTCRLEKYGEQREDLRVWRKAYYDKDPAAHRARSRKNYDLSKVRAYREKNREKVRTYSRERARRLFAENPEQFWIAANKRRALKRGARVAPITSVQIQSRFGQFDHKCAYCDSDGKLSIDHFFPLSKGGADAIGNLVPACKNCNSQKRDSDPVKWFSRQPTYSQEKLERILEILGISGVVQLSLFS